MKIEKYMQIALEQAKKAFEEDEVPIGACLVLDDKIIATGYNQTRKFNDPTAHAEVVTLRKAGELLGDWRLNNAKLFITVEPCSMCAGAIKLSRISEVYFGVYEPNMGAVGSLYNLLEDPRTGTIPKVYSGILAEPCQELIKKFFVGRRSS